MPLGAKAIDRHGHGQGSECATLPVLDDTGHGAHINLGFAAFLDEETFRTVTDKGELNTKAGLAKQVDRMMASPRLEAGVRAFFTDYLGFDEFDTLSKDPTLFPKFSAQAAADSQEQTLRTVVDLLLYRKGDFRDIFTTKKTFLTQELAAIYKIAASVATRRLA